MMRVRLIIISCLLSSVGFSQERLSLQDAVEKALQNNFDIRIADVEAQQAAANNTLGNAGFLPNVSLVAGGTVGSSNTRIEFADGRIQQVRGAGNMGYNAGAQMDYTLFAGGRAYILRKQFTALEEIGIVNLKLQIQNIISQTIQAYARVVWQQQQSIAIDTGLVLAKTRMILSQVKFESGISAKFDYLQARVDYNARQSDSLAQIAALNGTFADLNLLMGEDPFKTYLVDDSLSLNLNLQPIDKNNLLDLNLSIDLAKRNVEVARLNTRVAKSFLFPTLDLNAGYGYARTNSESGFALFNQSSGPNAGLNLTIPVFQGGNLRRQVKVASLQAFREELIYERQNTEIGRQYRRAWKDYEMSIAAYRLEKENINYAKENVDIQKLRFQVGLATTIETREAEDSYVQSLIRLYTAAYNLKVNETRVLELESKLGN